MRVESLEGKGSKFKPLQVVSMTSSCGLISLIGRFFFSDGKAVKNSLKRLNLIILIRCVLAYLYEGLSVRSSVRPSVRRLVGRSVTLLSKTREISIFEQNIIIGGILGHLDASLQLYKTVSRSIGLSVH